MSLQVHPVLLAEVNLSGRYNPPTFSDTRIPVYGFLILGDAECLLVDTGVGEGNDYIDRQFQPKRYDLTDALRQKGVAVTDVTMLINSHLHFDHCGNNHLFPGVPVYVQEQELEAAREPRYTIREWFECGGADIRAVAGDQVLTKGVRLISSPGHTPGHQSVQVDTGDQLVLIAAQAAFRAEEFERGGDPEAQGHEGYEAAYLDSIARLKSLAADRYLFSHDGAWSQGM